MADFFPPVVATFVASTGEATAQLLKLAESFERTGAVVTESTRAASASTAAMGERITATNAEVVVANERVVASTRMLAAEQNRATEQAYANAAQQAKTSKLMADLEAAQKRAAVATTDLGNAMDASAARGERAAARWGAVQKGALLVGAGAVLAGAGFVHMAADFETATNKLVTSAGESHHAIGEVRDGLLEMSSQVGVGAEDLAVAMYKVESAGYHGAAGLGLLKAAEQGAKAEGAEAVTVADALSSALRDYYPHASSAAEVTAASTDVMSKLIGATSAGKMTFDELSGSLNSILPVSSAAKISLADTLGVLASMTVHGISAQQAAQNMADAIRHLQSPTMVMSKAMATLGIDSVDLASKLGSRGLAGTMEFLSERVKKAMPPGSDKVILELGTALSKSTPKVQELGEKLLRGEITAKQFSGAAGKLEPLAAKQAQAFSTLAGSYHQLGTKQISGAEVMQTYGGMMQKVMGDATGLKVALMTTGENAEYTNDAIKTISGSTADASGNVKGWSEVQDTFNQKLSEAKAASESLGIRLGQILLPAATKVMEIFAHGARFLADHKWAAITLASVLGGALVIGLAAATAAMVKFTIALLTNPMTWIVLGIMALIAAIVLLIVYWDKVWNFITTVSSTAWAILQSTVITPLVTAFHVMMGALGEFAQWWVDRWNWVKEVANKIWTWVRDNIFAPIGDAYHALNTVVDTFRTIWVITWDAVGKAISWVWNHVIKPVVDSIKEAWDFATKAVKFFTDPRNNLFAGGGGGPAGFLRMFGFAEGGWIPGSPGQPGLFVGHGREYVLSEDMIAGRTAPDPAALAAWSTRTPVVGGVGSAGRGGGNTTVVINVAGSLMAERDLHRRLQDTVLRYNGRNTGNGLNLGTV